VSDPEDKRVAGKIGDVIWALYDKSRKYLDLSFTRDPEKGYEETLGLYTRNSMESLRTNGTPTLLIWTLYVALASAIGGSLFIQGPLDGRWRLP
jgi:hypothetical protein